MGSRHGGHRFVVGFLTIGGPSFLLLPATGDGTILQELGVVVAVAGLLLMVYEIHWSDQAERSLFSWLRVEGGLVSRRLAPFIQWATLLGPLALVAILDKWIVFSWTNHLVQGVSLVGLVILGIVSPRPWGPLSFRMIGFWLLLGLLAFLPVWGWGGHALAVAIPRWQRLGMLGLLIWIPTRGESFHHVKWESSWGALTAVGVHGVFVWQGFSMPMAWVWTLSVLSVVIISFDLPYRVNRAWPKAWSQRGVGLMFPVLLLIILANRVAFGLLDLSVIVLGLWPMKFIFWQRRNRPRMRRPLKGLGILGAVVVTVAEGGWVAFLSRSGQISWSIAWALWLLGASLVWARAHQLWPFRAPWSEPWEADL